MLGGEVDLPDVSFPAIHHWHATAVMTELDGIAPAELAGWRCLHERALAGEAVEPQDWVAALRPVLHEVYRRSYRYERAYAVAHANAEAYALANGFGDAERVEFADSYASMNTDANVASYAAANAIANADLMALAFASADIEAFVRSYPFARMCAFASASFAGSAPDALRRLAQGFVASAHLWPTGG